MEEEEEGLGANTVDGRWILVLMVPLCLRTDGPPDVDDDETKASAMLVDEARTAKRTKIAIRHIVLMVVLLRIILSYNFFFRCWLYTFARFSAAGWICTIALFVKECQHYQDGISGGLPRLAFPVLSRIRETHRDVSTLYQSSDVDN